MADTKIEWCDKSWNPVIGCTKCSPGCQNCYAERFAKRLKAICLSDSCQNPEYMSVVDEKGWTGKIELCEHRLEQPLHWRKPHKIFVCSMSDLFHEKVPFGFRDKVMYTIYRCYRHGHRFLILTKRIEEAFRYFNGDVEKRILKLFPNYDKEFRLTKDISQCFWLGVSISTPDELWKIEKLLEIQAAIRFVSFEPLLEHIPKFDYYINNYTTGQIESILHWVIIGCESINGKAGWGCEDEKLWWSWARNIIEQCKAAGIAVFMKQGPINGRVSHKMSDWPKWSRIRDWPNWKTTG